jgi:two-component system, OmpR family, sensor kinase
MGGAPLTPPRFTGPDEGALRRSALDQDLLRRFALVRVVGGTLYVFAALFTVLIQGLRVWPLLAGAVVLSAVTFRFFTSNWQHPRRLVMTSLLADTVALYGAIASVGGTSAGLVGLYAIVLVSAGILLGTRETLALTVLTVTLGLVQLIAEQLGFEPPLLYQPDLESRLTVLLLSLAGLVSVGYLATSYADRLHELIAQAGQRAEDARRRGARRHEFVQRAARDVRLPLEALEEVAEALEVQGDGLEEREALALRLRAAATRLDTEIAQLADVGTLDLAVAGRLAPVPLKEVVDACVLALGDRLAPYQVELEVAPIKVLGHMPSVRRVVYNLLENVVEHTPAGTAVSVRTRTTAGAGVLVVTDDGPGVPPEQLGTLFEGGEEGATVGLPLVRELCEQMDATIRIERPRSGRGARFLVAFRLAPRGAPTPEEQGQAANGV